MRKVIGDCYNQYVETEHMRLGPTRANTYNRLEVGDPYAPFVFRVSKLTNTRKDYGYFYHANTTQDQRDHNAHLWVERIDEEYCFENRNTYDVHVKIDALILEESQALQDPAVDFGGAYSDCTIPNPQTDLPPWRQDTRADDSADPILARNTAGGTTVPIGQVNTTVPTPWEKWDSYTNTYEHMKSPLSWVFPKLSGGYKVKRWKYFTVKAGTNFKFKKKLPVVPEVTWEKLTAPQQVNALKNKSRAYFVRMWTDPVVSYMGGGQPQDPSVEPINVTQMKIPPPAFLNVVVHRTVAWRSAGDSKPTFTRYQAVSMGGAADKNWPASNGTRSWNWLHSLGCSDGFNILHDYSYQNGSNVRMRVITPNKYNGWGTYYMSADGVHDFAFP